MKSEFSFLSPPCVSCRISKPGNWVREATCEAAMPAFTSLCATMAFPITPWSTPITLKSAAFFDTYSSRVTSEKSGGITRYPSYAPALNLGVERFDGALNRADFDLRLQEGRRNLLDEARIGAEQRDFRGRGCPCPPPMSRGDRAGSSPPR